MRRPMIGLAVGLAVLALAPSAKAQVGLNNGFSDPFYLYYGFYLPRQAALSAQPTTPNVLNDVVAQRQNFALADRAGLYDPPVSPFGLDSYDPSAPFAKKGNAPLPRLPSHFIAPRPSNGQPPMHFDRTARHYPTMRPGSFANRNVAVQSRFARSSAGGFGMGGYGGQAPASSIPTR